MKNLKKVLALVMVCAMFFTVSSFAFTDVEEDASYLEAVTLLSKLGIINGYEDGTFLPDNTITRAEIAKVLVCALNATEQAEGAKADNIFTDVPASHWAAGYVNYAANMGIINGRGNGIYDPEAPVTYEEAVKLIVAMLGYTPVANVKGGYPTGYLYAANQVMKITKGATGTSGDAAKRWVVARLIYNALECRIMEQETWSAADPEFIKGSDTLLDDYLDITKLEAVVTSTFMEDFADKEDQDVDFRVSKVNGNQVYSTVDEEEVPYFDTFFEANGTGAEEYLGYNVVAYVKAYGEGDEELVAVAPKAGKNATLQIALGDFGSEMDELELKPYFTFEYFVDDDNTKTAKALDSIAFYANGILNEDIEEPLFDNIFDAIEDAGEGYGDDAGENDGVITFLDNDGNGVYDYAFLEIISKEIVVDEITKRTYKITSKNDAGSIKLDPEDEESYVTFYKDGKVASFDDIAEDDVLSVVEGWSRDAVKKVYISSNKVEGYVSSTSAAGYKIDGNVYKKSSFYEADINRRDSGIFYINYNGRIAFTDTEAEIGGNYGFLLAVNTNVSFSSGVDYTLRFMNTKGEWIDANLAETITVTAFDGVEMVSEKITDLDENIDDIDAASNGWITVNNNGEIVMADALTNRVFQYTLNSNGEVAKIVVADSTLSEDNFSYDVLNDEYDALGNRFKGEPFKGGVDKDTVVFKVALKDDQDITGARESDEEDETSSLKKSQITVADYTLFADEEAYEGFIYDYANDAYKCMVVTNAGTTIAKDAKLLVVSAIEITSNDDEEDYIIIEGYMDGEKVTLETVADEALESAVDVTGLGDGEDIEDLEAYVDGAVFEVALDGEGKITDIAVIFAADDFETAGVFGNDGEDDELPYYFIGAIATDKMTSSSAKFIQLYDLANEAYLVDGEGEAIDFATAGSLMKGNIYNVDLTGRKAKFDVADSIADYVGSVVFEEEVLVESEMYGEDVNYALVKVLEDEIIDIVVYTVEYVEAV